MDIERKKVAVAWLSVVSNTTLVVFKIIVGLLIGSVSVISEAIHSGVDLLASVIALIAVKTSSKPPDEDHPFGHGKVENVSGTVEAILIFAAAGWIIFEAGRKLMRPEPLEDVGWGVGVMLFSAMANLFVSRLLFKVGKEADSMALQADAWHLRTDVYTSAAVMGGLALIWGGESLFPGVHFHWIDPAAAIGVALLIIHAAWRLTVQSASDLLDRNLPPEEEAWIREYIVNKSPLVRGFHKLRTRKSGPYRFVDFHLFVKADMTVGDSHHITRVMQAEISAHFPRANVTIHVEPCDGRCDSSCTGECLLTEEERKKIQAG